MCGWYDCSGCCGCIGGAGGAGRGGSVCDALPHRLVEGRSGVSVLAPIEAGRGVSTAEAGSRSLPPAPPLCSSACTDCQPSRERNNGGRENTRRSINQAAQQLASVAIEKALLSFFSSAVPRDPAHDYRLQSHPPVLSLMPRPITGCDLFLSLSIPFSRRRDREPGGKATSPPLFCSAPGVCAPRALSSVHRNLRVARSAVTFLWGWSRSAGTARA